MGQQDYEAAVAAFIRARGVTRCPTVCAAPTQGRPAATDRLALHKRAERQEAIRAAKVRPLWAPAAIR